MMNARPARAVLFDLDGTLTDSRADLARAVNLTRADLGAAPLPVEVVAGYVGDGVRKLVERSTRDLPEVDLDDAVHRMSRHYSAHLVDETVLYPGTLEALDRILATGRVIAVVTNKPLAPAQEICRRLGLASRLGAILGGDSCEHRKPHPAPLAAALRELGAPVRGAWMVGDDGNDLRAARRLGLKRCWCRFGFGDPGDERYDLAVDDLGALVDELERDVQLGKD